jgi:uncharacterized protein YpmS
MKYRQKAENLVEAVDAKLRIIQNIAVGTMQLPHPQVLQIIEDTKKLNQQLAELISIETEA